jgi:hypothetical protein
MPPPVAGRGSCTERLIDAGSAHDRTADLMLLLLSGLAAAGDRTGRRPAPALAGWQPLLVHVGAHLGYLAMVAAARAGARAVGFEMVRDFAARARLSLELNELQVMRAQPAAGCDCVPCCPCLPFDPSLHCEARGTQASVELREARVSSEPRRMHTFRVGSRGLATPPFGAASGTELEGWGGFEGVRLDAAVASVARIDVLVITVDGCEVDVLESARALFDSGIIASVLVDICPSGWEQCGTLDAHTGVSAITRLCAAASCGVYEMGVASEGDSAEAAMAAPAVAELQRSLPRASVRLPSVNANGEADGEADASASAAWELPSGVALHATLRRLAELRACMSVAAVMRDARDGLADWHAAAREPTRRAGAAETDGRDGLMVGAEVQPEAQALLLDESAGAVLELS